MARDGNGDFSRVAGPYVGGTTILKDNINDELDDVADALSDSINKAGTKPMAANLPMAGFKVTGLAASSSNGDAVRHEQLTALSSVYEAKDAGLTSLAGLAWSAGQNLVKATAADTFALSNELAQATVPLTLTNNADAAANQGLIVQSDRATPTAGDIVYVSLRLSDSAGNQDEFARIAGGASDVTSGSEDGVLYFYVAQTGVITQKMQLHWTNTLGPVSNDDLALGNGTFAWSDLFLASGGTINANNSDAIITHVTGGFEVTGTFRARTALSSEASGVLTAASANKRVKATGGVTINDGVFTAEDALEIYNDSDVSITITQDTGMTLRQAGTTTTGNRTLAARGIAYIYFDTNADAAVGGTGVT